jgi:hypothetical protein
MTEPVERRIRSAGTTTLRWEERVPASAERLLLGKCRASRRRTGSSHGVSTFVCGRHFAVFVRFDPIPVMRFI